MNMTPTPLSPTDNRPLSGKALLTAVEALTKCRDWIYTEQMIRHYGPNFMGEVEAAIATLQEAAIQQQPEPVAWLRADGMKAMPADEKAAWIEAGSEKVCADYTVPLYAASPAIPQPDGYVQAFYEMAQMLGIEGAQAKSPQQVYLEQIKPALQRALQQKEEPSGPTERELDMAVLIRQLCARIAGHPDLRTRATDYLRRQGLLGSILRSPSPAEKPAEDAAFRHSPNCGTRFATAGQCDCAEKPAEGEPGGVGEVQRG